MTVCQEGNGCELHLILLQSSTNHTNSETQAQKYLGTCTISFLIRALVSSLAEMLMAIYHSTMYSQYKIV